MPQPEVIVTSMTTAFIQCMILMDQGCSLRPFLVGDTCIIGDSFDTSFIDAISLPHPACWDAGRGMMRVVWRPPGPLFPHHRDSRIRTARPSIVTIEQPAVYFVEMPSSSRCRAHDPPATRIADCINLVQMGLPGLTMRTTAVSTDLLSATW